MNKKPQKGEYLGILLRSPRTIFSTKDAALLWNESNGKIVSDRLKKYVNTKKLVRVRRGFYAKNKEYNQYELATRIYTPSYISFETVLGNKGVTFQHYGNIFVASYVSRDIEINGQRISFLKIKDYVLSDTKGVEQINGVAIATKERAMLDRIYVSKKYYFDNLQSVNWNKVFEILPIYNNKRMENTVKKYFENYQLNSNYDS